jgi:hypothetical protein
MIYSRKKRNNIQLIKHNKVKRINRMLNKHKIYGLTILEKLMNWKTLHNKMMLSISQITRNLHKQINLIRLRTFTSKTMNKGCKLKTYLRMRNGINISPQLKM